MVTAIVSSSAEAVIGVGAFERLVLCALLTLVRLSACMAALVSGIGRNSIPSSYFAFLKSARSTWS